MSMPNPKSLAILAIFLASLIARTYAGTYSGGTGERNDPYQIATAEDVIELSLNGRDWDKHFLLTADINLDPKLEGRKNFTEAVIAPDREYFFPNNIFYRPSNYFTGTFDGNGHTIQNLTIAAGANIDYCGFFGGIPEGAEVRNLGLIDVNIVAGEYTGALAGLNDGRITNCYATGTVAGTWTTGGLVGKNEEVIERCFSEVDVEGVRVVGGLVGWMEAGAYEGGGNSGPRLIKDSYSLGQVHGDLGVGGLLGVLRAAAEVENCYSAGEVIGNLDFGGLIGVHDDLGYNRDVTNSFYDKQSSQLSLSAGGRGLATADMKFIHTYLNADWDFTNESQNGTKDIWRMAPGEYPSLAYEPFAIGLSPLDAMVATGHDGSIVSLGDADTEDLFLGTTLFNEDTQLPGSHPEFADDLDLQTVALSEGQSQVRTLFTQPTKKVYVLIRGMGQNGQVRLLNDEARSISWVRGFETHDWAATDYQSSGQTVYGMIVTSSFDFQGIQLSAPEGELLHLALVATVAATDPVSSEPIIDNFESGDFSVLDWRHAGDSSWEISSDEPYSGKYCARAGFIQDDETSKLKLTTECSNGQISFFVRVSSESGFDELSFWMDGTRLDDWSGEVDWLQTSYSVTEGIHTFEWRYEKDGSDQSGSDTTWIDEVTVPVK